MESYEFRTGVAIWIYSTWGVLLVLERVMINVPRGVGSLCHPFAQRSGSPLVSSYKLSERAFYLIFWHWKVPLHDIPNLVEIDPEIIVDDDISEGSNLPPLHCAMSSFQVVRNTLDRFR